MEDASSVLLSDMTSTLTMKLVETNSQTTAMSHPSHLEFTAKVTEGLGIFFNHR